LKAAQDGCGATTTKTPSKDGAGIIACPSASLFTAAGTMLEICTVTGAHTVAQPCFSRARAHKSAASTSRATVSAATISAAETAPKDAGVFSVGANLSPSLPLPISGSMVGAASAALGKTSRSHTARWQPARHNAAATDPPSTGKEVDGVDTSSDAAIAAAVFVIAVVISTDSAAPTKAANLLLLLLLWLLLLLLLLSVAQL
jgi:hypothetical protein